MRTGLFDAAAEAVSVKELADKETSLRKAGKEWRGPCPLCEAGAKSKSGPFAVKPEKSSWECFACGKFGDVTDLERELRGGTWPRRRGGWPATAGRLGRRSARR